MRARRRGRSVVAATADAVPILVSTTVTRLYANFDNSSVDRWIYCESASKMVPSFCVAVV